MELKKEKLTQKKLKSLLNYNPTTGEFKWKVSRGGRVAGDIAGSKNDRGYVYIAINSVHYRSHRLAWLYVYGYIPENGLDHKNRVKEDNRVENLREITQQCNRRNSKMQKNNTSGVSGVSWGSHVKKWISCITVNRIKKHLGAYDDFCDAVCARLAAEQCLNWKGCDSNSPAYQYVTKKIKEKA